VASFNKDLWQTVVFLFLSKSAQQANTVFSQQDLISEKNIGLAHRFVEMVGDSTKQEKIKFALLKALRGMEKEGLIVRLSETSLQFSDAGFTKMQKELKTAMTKIAQSFPESTVKDKSEPIVQ